MLTRSFQQIRQLRRRIGERFFTDVGGAVAHCDGIVSDQGHDDGIGNTGIPKQANGRVPK